MMVRRYYVDVSRTSNGGKRRSKLHVAYDGRRIVKVKKLTDLQVSEGDEVYIDCLFSEVYDDLVELLMKGVRIYLLKRTKLVKHFRDGLGLRKNDENDAIALSKIPEEAFRELSLREVEVKRNLHPLLERYEIVSRRLKTVRQWKSGGWDFEGLKMLEKELRRIQRSLGKRIVEIAEDEFEMYKLAEKELGLRGVRLTYLLMRIDLSKGIQKIKGYARLNRRVREVLASYAMVVYMNTKRGTYIGKYAEVVRKAANRKEALKKIQDLILKDLRRLWRRHFEEES